MKIWIDLANSPQVLFFRPLIPELRRRGHLVTVTTRYFAQTVELADRLGFKHTPIGTHGGRRISNVALKLVKRAWELLRFAGGKKFDLAISHNSYAQALVAKILRIPFVTSMDYEHQPANHLCFRLADRIIVPEFFPHKALKRFGVKRHRTAFYKGTKEEIYLADFFPRPDYLDSVGIPTDKVIVVLRPPGTWALYHNFENPLFDKVLDYVAENRNTQVVFLPRIKSQMDFVRAKKYNHVIVPPEALDGPNLLYHADLVISAGGTMNREAAVLGTPTYSLFKGKLAAVDRYLMEKGCMNHVNSIRDVTSIPLCKKPQPNATMTSNNPVPRLVHQMLNGYR